MSNIEIKKRLINKIKSSKNQLLLEEIYRLLELEYDNFEILELSVGQKNAIRKGQLDIKKGKTLSNEQANAEIDQWLKK